MNLVFEPTWSMFRVFMSHCCSYYAWFNHNMKKDRCDWSIVIYYCCVCEVKKRDRTQMTRKTPTKKRMVKENQNTPCKRTPIKESKMTPTRGRFNLSTSQGKKMFTTILRGSKLGWGYFLRARPDTYADLDMWMIKTIEEELYHWTQVRRWASLWYKTYPKQWGRNSFCTCICMWTPWWHWSWLGRFCSSSIITL